jgi:pyruvate/2-oxoglutarate dehydrogenase complex dihydrolipoamide dehydrogenase (E3) component
MRESDVDERAAEALPAGKLRQLGSARRRRWIGGVGAHIVTAEAGEVVPAATHAVKHGLTVDDLAGTLFPYLTYAEALRLAAVSFDKDLDKLSCCV